MTVHVLHDTESNIRIQCSSYQAAIEEVKQRVGPNTVVKIEDKDGDVVFTSSEMDIEAWETEWRYAKRRQSVDVEQRDCPYDNRHCFTDSLCVRCQIDKVQAQSGSTHEPPN